MTKTNVIMQRHQTNRFPKGNGVGVTFDGKLLPIVPELFSFGEWLIYGTYDLPLPASYEGRHAAYAQGLEA